MNKRIDHSLLTAAMSTPDDDINPPTKTQQRGLVAQIAELSVGEATAKVKPVNAAWSLERYAMEGANLREVMRSSVSSSLRVAKARTGGEYEVELTEVMTTKRMLYVVALITRVS